MEESDPVADDVQREELAPAWYSFAPMRAAGAGALVLALAYLLQRSGLTTLPRALYLLAMAVGGRYWMREGLEKLLEDRRLGIDALMACATAGAVILGEWLEAGMLVTIYAAAEALEELAYSRTRSAMRGLLDLTPETAHRVRVGEESDVPARELVPGDVILIRPGERVPTDAVILSGRTSVDESAVTGEALPLEKGPGNQLFAGTVNTTGGVTARCTADLDHNTVSRMVHLVEKAQKAKSERERWIDRFGAQYTPSLLLVSLSLVLFSLSTGTVETWAYRGVLLLVAGAPCALVMSIPVATASAIARAGREGILISGGIYLELLERVKVIAFDKTGTLTRGEPFVTDVIPAEGEDRFEVIRTASAVEQWSEHPLGRGVVHRARREGLRVPTASHFEAIAGAGVKAMVEGRGILVGQREFMGGEVECPPEFRERLDHLEAEGKTVVLVVAGGDLLGAIALRDEPHPGTGVVLGSLQQMGITVAMLTGNNERTARAVALELGIDLVRAQLRPEEKVAALRELEESVGPAAMMGDGINDAPALAAAAVGIAMGTGGSDAAVQAADVALVGDDPSLVLTAFELAQRSQRIARQNVILSGVLLAILIPSALTGAIGIGATILAHEVGELLAIANGLRAGR